MGGGWPCSDIGGGGGNTHTGERESWSKSGTGARAQRESFPDLGTFPAFAEESQLKRSRGPHVFQWQMAKLPFLASTAVCKDGLGEGSGFVPNINGKYVQH